MYALRVLETLDRVAIARDVKLVESTICNPMHVTGICHLFFHLIFMKGSHSARRRRPFWAHLFIFVFNYFNI